MYIPTGMSVINTLGLHPNTEGGFPILAPFQVVKVAGLHQGALPKRKAVFLWGAYNQVCHVAVIVFRLKQ